MMVPSDLGLAGKLPRAADVPTPRARGTAEAAAAAETRGHPSPSAARTSLCSGGVLTHGGPEGQNLWSLGWWLAAVAAGCV